MSTHHRTLLISLSLLLSSLVCTGYAGGPASQLRRAQQTELVVSINREHPAALDGQRFEALPCLLLSIGGKQTSLFNGAWLQHAALTHAALRRPTGHTAHRRCQPLKTIPSSSDEDPKG